MDNNSFVLGFFLCFLIFATDTVFTLARDVSCRLSVRLEEFYVSSRFFVSHKTLLFKVLFHWSDFVRKSSEVL